MCPLDLKEWGVISIFLLEIPKEDAILSHCSTNEIRMVLLVTAHMSRHWQGKFSCGSEIKCTWEEGLLGLPERDYQ